MNDQGDPGKGTQVEDTEERDDEQDRDEAEREGIAEDNRLERAIGHNDEG